MADIPPDSFSFGTKNSLRDWGIKCINHDVIMPSKRDRRRDIPFRDGAYDFGAKWYGERILRIDCVSVVGNNAAPKSRADTREVIYALSGKEKITLWDEPDKYYVGEILNSSELNVLNQYIGQRFTLQFQCEPFAYKDVAQISIADGSNRITYQGTRETSCLIILKNNNDFTINNIQVVLTRRLN